jgi:hypothetical protein
MLSSFGKGKQFLHHDQGRNFLQFTHWGKTVKATHLKMEKNTKLFLPDSFTFKYANNFAILVSPILAGVTTVIITDSSMN